MVNGHRRNVQRRPASAAAGEQCLGTVDVASSSMSPREAHLAVRPCAGACIAVWVFRDSIVADTMSEYLV
jgi:hypothetical protein